MTTATVGNTVLVFDFENHNGEMHQYTVRPKSFQYQACQCFMADPGRTAWCMTADVLLRDGRPRPGERTFALCKMDDIEEFVQP